MPNHPRSATRPLLHLPHRALPFFILCIALGTNHAEAEPLPDSGRVQILSLRYGPKDHRIRQEVPPPAGLGKGGDAANVNRYSAIGLPEGRGELAVSFGAPSGAHDFPARLQFKLEGYDSAWRDMDRGFMHVVLKFFDSNRIPLSRAEFRISGNSRGWQGTIESSDFTVREERVTVPPRAAYMSIWIDSGGHDENAGVWLVDDIEVFDISNPENKRMVFREDFESGIGLDFPQGDFAAWVRDGGALEGAMVQEGIPASGNHALLIVDSNPLDYTAWRLKDQSLLPVVEGQKLALRWKEIYSVGWGRGGQANYQELPRGQYQFHIREVDAHGRPVGEEAVVPIIVAPPLHANPWFLAAMAASVLALVLVVERLVSRARTQRKVEELERRQAVERERARIARDIHDDLGTVLSRIAMAGESVSLEVGHESPYRKRLDEICEASRDLSRTMEQIVWAQNPVHDSIDNTASFFSSFATDLLSAAGMACRLDIPIDLPSLSLEAERRHELFLVFKEILNNIIKHSRAGVVRIGLRVGLGSLFLTVEDDGSGFNPESARGGGGNGLSNMTNRLQRLGGKLNIISSSGKGTRIDVSLPLDSQEINK